MTEKELRQLNRHELLEMLKEYSRANINLELKLERKEEELLRQQKRFEEELTEEHKKLLMLGADVRKLQAEKKELLENQKKNGLHLLEAGNIAEATVRISGIFEEAQKTAEMYLENIKTMAAEQETYLRAREEQSRADLQKMGEEASKLCIAMQEQTQKECYRLKEETRIACMKQTEETERYCSQLKESTENYCRALRSQAGYESNRQPVQPEPQLSSTDISWNDFSSRMEAFYQAHQGMKELFDESGMKMPSFMETELEEKIQRNIASFNREIDEI